MINGGFILSATAFFLAFLKGKENTNELNNNSNEQFIYNESDSSGASPRDSPLYLGRNMDDGCYDEFYDFDNPISELFLGVQQGIIPSTSYPEALRFRIVAPYIAVGFKTGSISFPITYMDLVSYFTYASSPPGIKTVISDKNATLSVPCTRYSFKFRIEIFNPFQFPIMLNRSPITALQFCYKDMAFYDPAVTVKKDGLTGLQIEYISQFQYRGDVSKNSQILTQHLIGSRSQVGSFNGTIIPPQDSVFIDIRLTDSGLSQVVARDSITVNDNFATPENSFPEIPFSRDLSQLKISIEYSTPEIPGRKFTTDLNVYGSGSPSIERNWKYWTSLYLGEQFNVLRPEHDEVDNIFSARGR